MPTKRAFLVGINEYRDSNFNLKGCRNDVDSLRNLLTEDFGFLERDIRRLYDADATRDAILQGVASLVSAPGSGDVLVFAFAGHGTQKGFNIAGEADGKDEALVPFEMNYNSLVTDDEIFNVVASAIPDDGSVNFTAIYDSCHSGTMLRSVGFDSVTGEIEAPVVNRCIAFDSLEGLQTRDQRIGPYTTLSACRDNETAADVPSVPGVGESRGAFSYALHSQLKVDPARSVGSLESSVSQVISRVTPHKQEPVYHVPGDEYWDRPLFWSPAA